MTKIYTVSVSKRTDGLAEPRVTRVKAESPSDAMGKGVAKLFGARAGFQQDSGLLRGDGSIVVSRKNPGRYGATWIADVVLGAARVLVDGERV